MQQDRGSSLTGGVHMHSFVIDVKGGESRRILPSITKGEIVGHRLSLMPIWKYLRGGDRNLQLELMLLLKKSKTVQ